MATEQWATWVAMGMQLGDDVRIWCKDLRNSGWNGAGSLAMTTPRQSWLRGPQSQWGWGVIVKSGSTPVGGPVKSGQKRTKDKGRGLDKELVRLELVTACIQRLRTTSIDPLRRFRSRRGDRDRDRDGQNQE